MGGRSSTTYVYTSNDNEVNASLNNVRAQLKEVEKNVSSFKTDTQMTVMTMQRNFNSIDNKFKTINDDVIKCFQESDRKIGKLTNYVEQMASTQALAIENLRDENFLIAQNIWKQEYLGKMRSQIQMIQNVKGAMELERQQKVISYLLVKDDINTKGFYMLSNAVVNMNSNMSRIVEHLRIRDEERGALVLDDTCLSVGSVDNGHGHGNDRNQILDVWTSLDAEIKADHDLINVLNEKFTELDETKQELEQDIRKKIENFTNRTLTNCLSSKITPQTFAEKLFDSGFYDIKDITIDNEDRLLISNGYAYMPEYKYAEIRNKFIAGFESINVSFFIKISNWLYNRIFVRNNEGFLEAQYSSTKTMIFNTIYDVRNYLLSDKFPYKYMCKNDVLMQMTIKFYNKLLSENYVNVFDSFKRVPKSLVERCKYIDKIGRGLTDIETRLLTHPYIVKWCYPERNERIDGLKITSVRSLYESLLEICKKSDHMINIYSGLIRVYNISDGHAQVKYIDYLSDISLVMPKIKVEHAFVIHAHPFLSHGQPFFNHNDRMSVVPEFKTNNKNTIECVYNLILDAFRTYIFYSMATETEISGGLTDKRFNDGMRFV